MAEQSQAVPTTKEQHFATLLVMALDPEEVGARIRQAREAKELTHQEFADLVGEALDPPRRLNLRTVQRWQKGINPTTGKSWLPKLKTLGVIADVLGVPASYFVESDTPVEDQEWRDQIDGRLDSVARTTEENTAMLAELLRIARGDPEEPQSPAAQG